MKCNFTKVYRTRTAKYIILFYVVYRFKRLNNNYGVYYIFRVLHCTFKQNWFRIYVSFFLFSNGSCLNYYAI